MVIHIDYGDADVYVCALYLHVCVYVCATTTRHTQSTRPSIHLDIVFWAQTEARRTTFPRMMALVPATFLDPGWSDLQG